MFYKISFLAALLLLVGACLEVKILRERLEIFHDLNKLGAQTIDAYIDHIKNCDQRITRYEQRTMSCIKFIQDNCRICHQKVTNVP